MLRVGEHFCSHATDLLVNLTSESHVIYVWEALVSSAVSLLCSKCRFALQDIHFVDLNDESIMALHEALETAKQRCSLTFLGRPLGCTRAEQEMQHQLEVTTPSCPCTCRILLADC